MYIADYLSRNFLKTNSKEEPVLKELVHTIESDVVFGFENDIPISGVKLQLLQNETGLDKNLKQILEWQEVGWPCNNKKI